jgi:hypothetical protein
MLTNEKKTGKVGEDGVKATWGWVQILPRCPSTSKTKVLSIVYVMKFQG